MNAQAFFERAIREAQRYGDDRWIFLRELVQNSRDAGATHIYCYTDIRDQWSYLDFQDNGEGMDATQFERYLLRLYASSKENDAAAIGFYGVGFWSTLLFRPHLIRIASCKNGNTIAYEINCQDLSITPFDAKLKHDGTRITLIRPTTGGDDNFAQVVAERLRYYTGPVRPAPHRHKMVLMCNGEVLNVDFDLPPHFSRRIREKGFDGVIGLGDKPSIKLYKGGILVRDLTSLEEILPNRKSNLSQTGLGLYPQLAINADGLTVLMDRQSVFEDGLLLRIVETCEHHLMQIQRQMVQQLFPLNWHNRFLHFWQKVSFKKWGWSGLALLLLGAVIWFSKNLLTESSSMPAETQMTSRPGYVDAAFQKWEGPVIDTRSSREIQWNFRYEGGPPYILFRVTTLTRYDKNRGWLTAPQKAQGPYPTIPFPEGETPILVSMQTQTIGSPIPLPIPPKYRLIKHSVVTASGKQPQIMQSQLGHPLVTFQQAERLSYQVIRAPSEAPVRFHQALTIEDYPADFQSFFQSIIGLSEKEKAQAIAEFLTRQFEYSRSPEAARKFQLAKGDFLERIRSVGGGDCDLLNGVYALMLQTADVPAYLSVGLVGKQGRAESSLHAWVRYWADGRWITADIIAPRHLHTIRPNQAIPLGPPANLDETNIAKTQEPSPQQVPRGSNIPAQPLQSATEGSYNLWPFLLICLAAGLIGLLFWLWSRSRKNAAIPHLDQPHYIANLFENYFHRGMGQDPLRLHFRPIFPTLRGGAKSLFQIRRIMHDSPLLGAKNSCPLIHQLPKSLPILDRDQPHLQLLMPFLPTVTWLDDYAFLTASPNLPPAIAAAVTYIQKHDPHFRLHLKPQSKTWQEVYIPFNNQKGKRHLVIGAQNDHAVNWLLLGEDASAENIFEILRIILERSTFYMGRQQAWLSQYVSNHLAAAAV